MKKNLLIVSLISIFNFQFSISFAQDTNYMHQVLCQLTSERLHGRGYSFRGDSIAADFIRGELRRLKVQPLVADYYQPYTFSVHSMEGPLRLKVDGKRLEPYTQFRVPSWSKSSWGDYKVLTVSPEVLVDTDAMRKFLKKNNDLLQDIFV